MAFDNVVNKPRSGRHQTAQGKVSIAKDALGKNEKENHTPSMPVMKKQCINSRG